MRLFNVFCLWIKNRLTCIEHAVVLHIVQVIVASIITRLQLRAISFTLCSFWSNSFSRRFLQLWPLCLIAAWWNILFYFLSLRCLNWFNDVFWWILLVCWLIPCVFNNFLIILINKLSQLATEDWFSGPSIVNFMNFWNESESFRRLHKFNLVLV
jgi:hypothetical protein